MGMGVGVEFVVELGTGVLGDYRPTCCGAHER